MDHKKLNLSSEDLKKLQALLKDEEARVDAMSDAELEEAERALEQRIQKLPHFQGGVSPKDKAEIDNGWQKLQKQLNPSSREDFHGGQHQDHEAKVVPFKKSKKAMPWATLSVFAAAALALLVLYPNLQKNQMDQGDPNQMQVKGTGEDGAHVYTAFCDVDVRGPSQTTVEEAGVGQGYEVDANAHFNISVLCDKPGAIQIWSKTSQAKEVRDSKVTANVRTFVMEDGQIANFTLAGKPSMTLEIALTDGEIKTNGILFDLQTPATKIGDSNVLWTDSINFREKK